MNNTRKIALALAAGTALMAAAPAFAKDHGWRGNPHYRHHHRAPAYGYYPPRPVYVAPPAYYYAPAPAPAYYAPAPAYYAPAPVYYAPAPAIYGQIPLGHNARIGFRIGL